MRSLLRWLLLVIVLTTLVYVIIYHRKQFQQHSSKLWLMSNTNSKLGVNKKKRDILVYNRHTKCGSSTLKSLMKKLAANNHFNYIYPEPDYVMPPAKFENFESSLKNYSQSGDFAYVQHFPFIDVDLEVTWINLVRDPVDRILSKHMYELTRDRPGKPKIPKYIPFDEAVKSGILQMNGGKIRLKYKKKIYYRHSTFVNYFCGIHPDCAMLNNQWALAKAKSNIINQYTVVGTLENLNQTLSVLETVIPRFFANATKVYYHANGIHENRRTVNDSCSDETREYLRRRIWSDYVLYHFIQQRLMTMYDNLLG